MTLTDLIIRIFLTSLVLASLLFPAHSYKEDLDIKKSMMAIEAYNDKAKTLSRTTLDEYRVVIKPRLIEIQIVKYDEETKEHRSETIEHRNIDIHNVDMHKIYTEYYEKVEINDEKKEITITWNEFPIEGVD